MNKLTETLAVLLLLVAAFLYRYWHLFTIGWVSQEEVLISGMLTTHFSIFHFSDSAYYNQIVKNFLLGQGINIPFPPPFTLFFLTAVYKMVGENYFYLKLVYNIAGTFALLFIYLSVRDIFNKKVALLTLLLCSISFTLIFITAALNIENVYLFTLSLSVYIFIQIYKRKEKIWHSPFLFSIIFGICSAFALLTRSEFLIILLILLIMLISNQRLTVMEKTIAVVGTFLGILIILSPWIYRNYYYMTDFNKRYPQANLPVFVPLALNGPFNFYEGHNPRANGTYAPPFSSKELLGGYGIHLDPENEKHLQPVRNGYMLGLKYIKEHPEKELSLLPVKIKVFLNGYGNGFFLNNFPAGFEGGIESYADSFVPENKITLLLGLFLFLFGAFVIIREKRLGILRFIPFYILGVVLLITILFYGLSRLSYPMLPFYFMVIAAGVVRFFEKLSPFLSEWQKKIVLFGIIFILFFILFYQAQKKVILLKGKMGEFGKYSVSVFGRE